MSFADHQDYLPDDSMADARALYEAARVYVRAWAKVSAPHVPAEKVESYVAAVGEAGVQPICDVLARLELEYARSVETP